MTVDDVGHGDAQHPGGGGVNHRRKKSRNRKRGRNASEGAGAANGGGDPAVQNSTTGKATKTKRVRANAGRVDLGVRSHVTMAFLFSAAINILYLAPSLYMLQVYDRVLQSNSLLTLLFISIAVAVALITLSLLDAVRSKLMGRMSTRLENKLLEPVLRATIRISAQNTPPSSGVRDLDNLRAGVSSQAFASLLDLPWTPLYVVICFIIHPWIGYLAVGGAVLIMIAAWANERASKKHLESARHAAPPFYGAHEADLRSAETVKAMGLEDALIHRRVRERSAMIAAQAGGVMTGADYSALIKFVRLILQSAALGLGAYLAVNQQISPGSIIAASILTARAFAPVQGVVGGWRQIAQTRASYNDLKKLIEVAPADLQKTPLPAPGRDIRLTHVAASAPGRNTPAIRSVSLIASAGEIVGIVGHSGAGKSTLARVLANAATPMAGTVRIDGASYADWDSAALARHIGYIPQTTDLFAGTVAENIAGFPDLDVEDLDDLGERVIRAAQLAGAHDMILSLPNGYETPLGLGGRGLSLGQAQRVALARAMFDDPAVLVLDEPNSHLDAAGEAALIDALKVAKERGAICFVIAHRAGVISICDKLAVMHGGQIIEFGPRDKVTAKLAANGDMRVPAQNSTSQQAEA